MIHNDTSAVLEWQKKRGQCNLTDFNLILLPQKSDLKVIAIAQLSLLTKTIKTFLLIQIKLKTKSKCCLAK